MPFPQSAFFFFFFLHSIPLNHFQKLCSLVPVPSLSTQSCPLIMNLNLCLALRLHSCWSWGHGPPPDLGLCVRAAQP